MSERWSECSSTNSSTAAASMRRLLSAALQRRSNEGAAKGSSTPISCAGSIRMERRRPEGAASDNGADHGPAGARNVRQNPKALQSLERVPCLPGHPMPVGELPESPLHEIRRRSGDLLASQQLEQLLKLGAVA